MEDGEVAVVQLQEFCGVDKHQAAILLKKYATVEGAANAFFTDRIGALKEETPHNEWGPADNMPAFSIEAEDPINIPSMSRPPSRVGNRVNLDAAVGQQFGHQVYTQDDDLQRAIAMSKQSIPGQESGTTATGQQFGPATRAYYDPKQWAVTAVASSRELIEHSRPSKRRRLVGQPAFLRGSRETGYLAPLLNIYHNIPLARHAFLFPSFKVLSYGSDTSWWAGTSDENNKSISVETTSDHNVHRHNFLAELQCLMAFLDKTERAYGSVDALADLYILKNFVSETALARLIQAWIAAGVRQNPNEQLTQIFTSEALRAPSAENMEYDQKEFQVLDAPIEDTSTLTLIDLMDKIIWNDSIDKVDDVWMERCAQVFTMRLDGTQSDEDGLGLEIPAVWYPERYMGAYKEAAREMRGHILHLQKQVQRCALIQRRCTSAQAADKRMIKIREVLQAASRLSPSVAVADPPSDLSSGSATDSSPDPSDIDIEAELQAILARIDQKVVALEAQKRNLRAEMRNLSQSLTVSAELTPQEGRLKYILQGVSTKPNITYVRVQSTDESDLGEPDETSLGQDRWKWWRIEWQEDATLPQTARGAQRRGEDDETTSYSIEQVTETQVLNAARTEHDSVLLVYADQQALTHEVPPLSTSLKKFVEQDNRAFGAELDEESGAIRLHTHDRNLATVDVEAENGKSMALHAREMTPMSISSLSRDTDGQPSPKRPRSHEGHPSSPDSDGEPPPYAEMDSSRPVATQPNKIGLLADQMLDKLDKDSPADSEGPVHIEHAPRPLR